MIINAIPPPTRNALLNEDKSEGHLAEKGPEWVAYYRLCTISAAEIHVYTIFTKSIYYSNFKSALSQRSNVVSSDALEIYSFTVAHAKRQSPSIYLGFLTTTMVS